MKFAAHIVQDLRYGVRSMRRALISSTTAVVVLALGVGAKVAVFSVVNKVLLEPQPGYTDERRNRQG
ncbi:MAG: hypothetical protein LC804_12680 [Acidobacteria bacterium]|nr:hypothetical protein [Acidobacteriota bacterium]